MRIKSQFLALVVIGSSFLSAGHAQGVNKALEIRRAEPMLITAKRLPVAEQTAQVRVAEPMLVAARPSRQGLEVAVEATPAISRNSKRLPS